MSMDSPTVEPNPERGPGAVAAPDSPRLCDGLDCRTELRPRQERFCSGRCRAAWWDAQCPRIATPERRQAEGGASIQALVLELLADGRQRTAPEIAFDLRRDSATVARELRKLRAKQPRLCAVTPGGGHERARWFLLGGAAAVLQEMAEARA